MTEHKKEPYGPVKYGVSVLEKASDVQTTKKKLSIEVLEDGVVRTGYTDGSYKIEREEAGTTAKTVEYYDKDGALERTVREYQQFPYEKTGDDRSKRKNNKNKKKSFNQSGWAGQGSHYSGGHGKTGFKRCFHTHPALPLNEGYKVYGGSCSEPVAKDADIYIGLDYSMKETSRGYPWHEGHEVLFRITDMAAPDDPEEFSNLIVWMAEQIKDGKKVHVGCIGGHGRTGTVFAALVKHMMGIEDAITYVRKHYCDKAVEAESQIEFLHKHWGIKKVEATKDFGSFSTYGGAVGSSKSWGWNGGYSSSVHNDRKLFSPMENSPRRIWNK